MEQYCFSAQEQALIEGMRVPLVVYQYIDKRIVTIALSEGFRALFDYADLPSAYRDMGHEAYAMAHPDDVGRVADVVFRFVTEDTGDCEVVYRSRTRSSAEYRVIHAYGTHMYLPSGIRLDYVWYADEGSYDENGSGENSWLNQMMSNALREESILKASRYDYLTGLPSMTYFFELAEEGKAAILRSGGHPVLMYMNLGGMKYFNHRYSFAEGDELLKDFAALLAKTFKSENCCHIAQDHFAVFTAEEGLEETLEQLFLACATLRGTNSLPVRVGIYQGSVEDVTVSVACDRAKIACDAIKNTYGSGFNYYTDQLRDEVKQRQYIQTNINRAIAEKWIQVYYQPIIRAANGKICGDEALSRWIDPEEGILTPDRFIPYLEDTGLIYKLDLYVVEQVLVKIRLLQDLGYQVVAHSINLSRSDFDACDIVEEIRLRVDAAGVDRSMIAVEITESIVGSDFDRMREQIERFHQLGFAVWLDDFGSGYSSLDALQSIPFEKIKFDMSLMRKLSESENSRIVLTELVKLATSLGSETICEGVETIRQVQFLQEIGCTMLQGYYFGKPLPLGAVLSKYKNPKIGYENPAEVPYYEAIGKVNLYDLDVIGSEGEDSLHNFFNTLPMGIIEVRGEKTRFVRSNQSYRDFVKRFLGFDLAREGTEFMPSAGPFVHNAMKTCCEQGTKTFYDQRMPNGATVHSFARRIATNPINGTTAVAVAVLSISTADEGTTYATIARALAADYYSIYYVDLDTEDFIEYRSPAGQDNLAMERHGEHFFASLAQDAVMRVYEEDRDAFLAGFTKENILRELDENGMYKTSCRLMNSGTPTFVGMKVTRLQPDRNQIIIGAGIIDSRMQERVELERSRKEEAALRRIAAIAGNYLAIYSIDPRTDSFVEFSASKEFESYGLEKRGNDFFGVTEENSLQYVNAADLPRYIQAIKKENILREVEQNGLFSLDYSLLVDGRFTPVSMRAAMVREGGSEQLILGVFRKAEMNPRTLSAGGDALQTVVNQVVKPSAVLSVEKNPDGSVGQIRIVCANEEYKTAMGSKYYDNMPYEELVPKVLQFENSCFRCAFQQQQIHTYMQTKVNTLWTDQQLIPLKSDREDIGYCQFILEFSEVRDRERMSAVSINTAGAVLRAAITLLGSNDLHERVRIVLRDIMEISEAFNVRVMLIDHENKRAINYCSELAIALPENVEFPKEDPDRAVISYKVVDSWAELIGESSSLAVTTATEMDELALRNPGWVRTMRAYGVETLLLIPLRHDGEVTGYLYLCNFNPDKLLEVRELAELMSFFIGTEIYNEVLLSRLDEMSHTDALTGLQNRNAMIQRTRQLTLSEEPISFGVINLDLNGLKTVNDLQGHDAGDRLLVSAAEMLKKYFYADDLYRTGGDEFIVVSEGITREAFARKVERLRAATGRPGNVSFAIGAYWSDGSADVSSVFRSADEIMYEDKKKYYEAHPEHRR